ncbi:MAG: hypothetical protein SchgKO_04600 [Schleiferiaceae bacterium]
MAQTQNPFPGLGTAIQLKPGETPFVPTDYFYEGSEGLSYEWPEGISVGRQSGDTLFLTGDISQAMASVNIQYNGKKYDIPLKRSAEQPYTLSFDWDDKPEHPVYLFGSFNAWNRTDLEVEFDKRGRAEVTLYLSPGTYEYKMFSNGEEFVDPSNEKTVSNGMGSFNNQIVQEMEGTTPKPISFIRFVGHQTEGGNPVFRESITGVDLQLRVPNNQFVEAYWQNQKLSVFQDGDQATITIPAEAERWERSFVRVYSGTEYATSNDLLIPIQRGYPVMTPNQLKRDDWETAIMYFLMIDRFKDGNPKNTEALNDPSVNSKADYHGGDIAGITQEIEAGFFDTLGVNTVWISPITQNPKGAWGLWDQSGVKTAFSGYHGYWPISNIKPDYRFGTPEEVHQFLDDAHAKNYNVLLDYVANHVHQEHPVYQKNPDWVTPLYLEDGSLNTERWDDHRLTTWFDTFMPTLDLRRREICEPMTDSAMVWVTEYDFDGFRHDATKHIDELYWRMLTQKVKNQTKGQQRIYQIGETYGSPELINSYISTGMLDAQFDFNLYDAAVTTFATTTDGKRLIEVLNQSLSTYGHHHTMGNISGNQDRSRFITLASGEVAFDEDQKLAGWTREIGPPQPEAYKKSAMLMAFNFAIPGIPVIYYGDEYGSYGGNDPDNRKDMDFGPYEGPSAQLRKQVIQLAHLRKKNMALLYGETSNIRAEMGVISFERTYLQNKFRIVINNSNEAIKLEVPEKAIVHFKENTETTDSGWTLKPLSFVYIEY